jgi:hypothetical protein
VAIGIGEVDAMPAIVVVDLIESGPHGIGSIRETALWDSAEDLVERRLADQEGVVLGRDPSMVWKARSTLAGGTENLGQKGGRDLVIAAPHDRMVQIRLP